MNKVTELFEDISDYVVKFAGHPVHFIFAIWLLVMWVSAGPFFGFSDTWQLIINTGTTIVTWILVILIQNAQNRNDLATHTKLDAIISYLDEIPNKFVALEELDMSEIRKLERELADDAKESPGIQERYDD